MIKVSVVGTSTDGHSSFDHDAEREHDRSYEAATAEVVSPQGDNQTGVGSSRLRGDRCRWCRAKCAVTNRDRVSSKESGFRS